MGLHAIMSHDLSDNPPSMSDIANGTSEMKRNFDDDDSDDYSDNDNDSNFDAYSDNASDSDSDDDSDSDSDASNDETSSGIMDSAALSRLSKSQTSKAHSSTTRPPKTLPSEANHSNNRHSKPISRKAHRSRERKRHSKKIRTSNLLDDAVVGEGHDARERFSADDSRDRVLKQIIDKVPQLKLSQARRDKKEFQRACQGLGRAAVKPLDDGMWSVPGMKTPLYSYQIVGAGRGRAIEKLGQGVILADQMGLGKTVQTLAAVASSRMPPRAQNRSTLIVVPPNLLAQWESEINEHCVTEISEHKKGAGIADFEIWNHGKRMNKPLQRLSKVDVVLTTYGDVVKSYEESLANKKLLKSQEDQKPTKTTKRPKKKASPMKPAILHQVKFNRICLDEAHIIRDKNGKSSKACRTLQAEKHWAITGTILTNSVQDLWSILAFLKHPLATFEGKAFRPALENAQVDLEDILISRTLASEIFGARLFELPKAHHENIAYVPTGLEAEIYRIVHNRFASYNLDGQTKQKGRSVLVTLLTRPRQLISHPMMLQHVLSDLMLEEGNTEFLNKLQPKLYEEESDKTLARLLYRAVKGNVAREDLHDESDKSCAKCDKSPEILFKTNCGHIYCEPCLGSLHKILENSICDACDTPIEESEEIYDNMKTGNESVLLHAIAHGRKVEYGKITDWIDERGKVWRSAKVHKTVECLKEVFRERPDEKVILFTQWLGFEQILAQVCEKEEGWPCVIYDGSMSAKAKEAAIDTFHEDDDKKILISSLKAGGIGLNLTVASNVFLLDHW